MSWLPNPPDGTQVCGGFDGSENDDWTAIKLETIGGHIFTPAVGVDREPTIWDPKASPTGRIQRPLVFEAWREIFARFEVERVYCDPGFRDEKSWETDIERWAAELGDEVFVPWDNTKLERMFPALRRFEADLESGITHDGCPITETHMRNASKVHRGERYTLGKPAQHQKIDAVVTSVMAHEAAADARSAGWGSKTKHRAIFFR